MVSKAIIIIIVAVLITILIVASCIWWLYEYNPHLLVRWWGRFSEPVIKLQDRQPPSGTTGLFGARHVRYSAITHFNNQLILEHPTLLMEAAALINELKIRNPDPYTGGEPRNDWKFLWVKYGGHWLDDKMPTLKRLSLPYKDIVSIWVGVLPHNGVETLRSDQNPLVRTFSYGLAAPTGDAGFVLDNKKLNWVNREGFVWDKTQPHMSWNRSGQPCVVISATFRRKLGSFYDLGTEIIYNIIRYSRHVKENLRELDASTEYTGTIF